MEGERKFSLTEVEGRVPAGLGIGRSLGQAVVITDHVFIRLVSREKEHVGISLMEVNGQELILPPEDKTIKLDRVYHIVNRIRGDIPGFMAVTLSRGTYGTQRIYLDVPREVEILREERWRAEIRIPT